MFERFIQDLIVINMKLDKGSRKMSEYTAWFIGAMVRRRYDNL